MQVTLLPFRDLSAFWGPSGESVTSFYRWTTSHTYWASRICDGFHGFFQCFSWLFIILTNVMDWARWCFS